MTAELIGVCHLLAGSSPLKESPVEESLSQRLDVSRMGGREGPRERGRGLEFPILSPSRVR